MNSNSRNKSAGFTLIEVMITVAILAFISLGIFQAVTSSFKIRDELGQEADFYTGIRLAMGIMNRDVTMMYTPTLLLSTQKQKTSGSSDNSGNSNSSDNSGSTREAPKFDESQIAAATAADLSRSFMFWSAAADKNGLRPARFIGTSSKMSFISATNFRVYKDSPESEFAKVTYGVEPDNEPPINGFKVDGSNILIKQINPDVFNNDDTSEGEKSHRYTLLRGVTSCKFTYYRWDDNKSFTAFTSWDSDKEDFRWRMPDMIQVEIEVKGQTGLSFTGFYQFKPEIPLNGLNSSF
ncbi:MAG: type II secretion system protein J [Bdellovibrionia bacterium]